MPDLSPARQTQLDEIWRVAVARLNGHAVALTESDGPLAIGSQTIYLQTLKKMLRGGRYTRAMNNGDANYFPECIERDLGPAARDDALKAIDQHITHYNALGKGSLIGARELHDRWRGKSGNTTTLPTLLALNTAFTAAVAASLTFTPATRARQSATYPEVPTKRLTTITTYDRNPHIVAEALLRGNGTCEACASPPPSPPHRPKSLS